MSMPRSRSRLVVGVLAAAVAASVVASSSDALARNQKSARRNLAQVVRQQAPLGVKRHNAAVLVPFTLVNQKAKRAVVEIEYGYDRNGDGVIADGSVESLPSEYAPCTHNRTDGRDTSLRGRRLLFRAGVVPGISHAFAWNADADLPGLYLDDQGRYLTTEDGRLIRDPNSPDDFLRAGGETGVRLRLRTHTGSGRRKVFGEWAYTPSFTVNNNDKPTLALGQVTNGDVVLVDWTGADADSEDTNGDGLFDLLAEDRDLDGVFDVALQSVAFDYSVVVDGEVLAGQTAAQLEARTWSPCTSSDTFGDTPIDAQVTPFGTTYTFAWDWQSDPTFAGMRVILRARGHDGVEHTETRYLTTPLTLGQ